MEPASPSPVKDAVVIKTFTVDMQILGMDMEDLAGELADDPFIIDHLQDEMRGIQVQSEIVIRDDLPHLAPDGRTCWPGCCRPAIHHRRRSSGSFRCAIFTPCSLANFTIGGQILAKSSRFSGTVLFLSLPIKVPTTGTSSNAAAFDHLL